MNQHRHTKPKERRHGRALAAGLFAVAVGLLATAGVYAALTGAATGTESVSSGTLNLTLTPDVGAGFSNFTGKMAPGDTNNVYVNLNNSGSLASAAGMTLAVAGAPANALTDGSVPGEGLTVSATQCSVTWTLVSGSCAGTTTTLLAATPVSTLSGGVALSNIPALAAATGQVGHVQISLGLTGTETSVNGVPPAKTIQGLSTTLTYTFTEQQRTGITTNQ